jgi:hypothetical protein
MVRLFRSSLRLFLLGGIGLSLVAVTLGRREASSALARRWEVPRFRPVNGELFASTRSPILDTETGELLDPEIPSSDIIDHAVASHWKDGQGRIHIAGRWHSVEGAQTRAWGLARFAYPGGEVLDRMETEILLVGMPCWYSGTASRILFAGGDGRFYQFRFSGIEQWGGSLGDDSGGPEALAWSSEILPESRPVLFEPTWPADARFDRTVIVSAQTPPPPGASVRGTNKLWYVRLSADGMTIEQAAPLLDPVIAREEGIDFSERFPAVATTGDGGLVLAFFARREDSEQFRLRLARLTVDETTGLPRVDGTRTVTLAEDQALTNPEFSVDGRWVYSAPRSRRDSGRPMVRYSVAESLPQDPTSSP